MKKKKLKILFRMSGGPIPEKEIGFGHVYRCINLASCLKGNEIFFLIEDYGQVKKILLEYGYKNVRLIMNKGNIDSDIKQTIAFIENEKIDVLIVDIFKINTDYLRAVRKVIKTVLIRDLKNNEYPVDLVINGFIGFKNRITKNKYGAKCLLGPSYQIINKKFSRHSSTDKKKYKLLATFGGFVNNRIIEMLLVSLAKHPKKIRTKIILGPGTVKSKRLSLLINSSKNNIEIIRESKNMYNEISQAEAGICSGGITTYEFASMGVPFAIICQANHQLLTACEWQRRGFALNLGLFSSKTHRRLEDYLIHVDNNKLHLHPDKKSNIDGKGAERVAGEILKMKSRTNL